MAPKCIEGTTHKTLIHACACTHMSNSIQWLAPNMRSQSSWLRPSRWMPAQSANIKLSRGLVQSFSKNQGEKPQQQQPQPHGSRAKKLSRQHWLSKHRMSRKRLKQQQQLRKKLQQLLTKQQQSLKKRLIKKKEMPKASTASDTKAAEATEEAADVTTDAAQQELVSDLLPMDTWPGAEAVVQPEASDEEQGLDSDDEEKTKRKRGGNKKGRLERQAREGHGYTKFNSLVEHVLKMYQPCQTLHTHTVPHCIYTHIKTS